MRAIHWTSIILLQACGQAAAQDDEPTGDACECPVYTLEHRQLEDVCIAGLGHGGQDGILLPIPEGTNYTFEVCDPDRPDWIPDAPDSGMLCFAPSTSYGSFGEDFGYVERVDADNILLDCAAGYVVRVRWVELVAGDRNGS